MKRKLLQKISLLMVFAVLFMQVNLVTYATDPGQILLNGQTKIVLDEGQHYKIPVDIKNLDGYIVEDIEASDASIQYDAYEKELLIPNTLGVGTYQVNATLLESNIESVTQSSTTSQAIDIEFVEGITAGNGELILNVEHLMNDFGQESIRLHSVSGSGLYSDAIQMRIDTEQSTPDGVYINIYAGMFGRASFPGRFLIGTLKLKISDLIPYTQQQIIVTFEMKPTSQQPKEAEIEVVSKPLTGVKPSLTLPTNMKVESGRTFSLDVDFGSGDYEAVQAKISMVGGDGSIKLVSPGGVILTQNGTFVLEGVAKGTVDIEVAFTLVGNNAPVHRERFTIEVLFNQGETGGTGGTGGSGGTGSSGSTGSSTTTTPITKEETIAEVVVTDSQTETQTKLSNEVSSKTQAVLENTKRQLENKATGANNVTLLINGKNVVLEDKIMMEHSRALLPVRNLSELLDLEVQYNKDLKVAIVSNGKMTLELPIGSNTAIINGTQEVLIDSENLNVRTIVVEGRTYLPVRFIAEQFGFEVDFEGKTINIKK